MEHIVFLRPGSRVVTNAGPELKIKVIEDRTRPEGFPTPGRIVYPTLTIARWLLAL